MSDGKETINGMEYLPSKRTSSAADDANVLASAIHAGRSGTD
ncbi:hypothetical protein [Streptomyces sp. NPDC005533]